MVVVVAGRTVGSVFLPARSYWFSLLQLVRSLMAKHGGMTNSFKTLRLPAHGSGVRATVCRAEAEFNYCFYYCYHYYYSCHGAIEISGESAMGHFTHCLTLDEFENIQLGY